MLGNSFSNAFVSLPKRRVLAERLSMWPKQRPLLKRPLNPNSALIISQAVSLFSALLSVAYPIWLVIWNASIISRISPATLYPKCLLLISGTPIIILDGWLEGFYEAWNTAADTVDPVSYTHLTLPTN